MGSDADWTRGHGIVPKTGYGGERSSKDAEKQNARQGFNAVHSLEQSRSFAFASRPAARQSHMQILSSSPVCLPV
eukprot:1254954-Rhodomonas_salina.3